jgi:hypothetical protein
MNGHEHEPLPGSVFDAADKWRPTAEQADPVRFGVRFPLYAKCVCSEPIIRRTPFKPWEGDRA